MMRKVEKGKRMEILVISHGDLAPGAVNAVKMIAGHYGHIHSIGLYEEDDPKEFGTRIKELISQFNSETEFFVFVDFMGGTPCNEILKILDQKNIAAVVGFNLGMLLDAYLRLSNESLTLDCADELIDIGRENITNLNRRYCEILDQEVDSDF